MRCPPSNAAATLAGTKFGGTDGGREKVPSGTVPVGINPGGRESSTTTEPRRDPGPAPPPTAGIRIVEVELDVWTECRLPYPESWGI